MKTDELTGAALDWAVAKCEGVSVRNGFDDNCPEYSINWSQGGPIIERENIQLEWYGHYWMAHIRAAEEWYGPTPLTAAMQCYVAYKLGDEVDVPEELLGEQA